MKVLTTSLALAAVVLTTLVGSGIADAQSTLETVKKRGKLVVGVKTDSPPFGTVAANGKNVGFDVDIAHRLAMTLFNDENQVEFVAVTGSSRIPLLQSERIDVIIASMTMTDERRQVVEFSDPYFMIRFAPARPANLCRQGHRGHGWEDGGYHPGVHSGQRRGRSSAERESHPVR